MSSAEFRQISMGRGRRDGDRLFSAAMSAFCSIARPTRQDADQLEDLVMPLLPQASDKTLRFAAAALSECEVAPIGLVKAICNEKSEVCAPLLVRYEGFSEADLITMISRHGIGHARIIAHRKKHHPVVRDLLLALGNEEITATLEGRRENSQTADRRFSGHGQHNRPAETGKAAAVRDRLRSILTSSAEQDDPPIHIHDDRIKLRETLRSTAFLENPVFFQTALADALAVDIAAIKAITDLGSWQRLAIALKALSMPGSDAFLLTFAVFPAMFTSRQSALDFISYYTSLARSAALKQVRAWRAEHSPETLETEAPARERTENPNTAKRSAANAGARLKSAS